MTTWQRWKGIQKCYPFEEKRLHTWAPPYVVQPKYDGVRCRAVPMENGNYLLLSSEENIVYSVPHLNKMFNHFRFGLELDGELYRHHYSFEQIVSITSRTTNLHPDHKAIQFHCFDVISGDPQMKRLLDIEKLKGLDENLVVAPYWLCNNLDEITRVYDNLVDQKYEGIIVRNLHGFYERKRSTKVMKFKPKQQDNYLIIGAKEEMNKDGLPKGTLGALVCQSGDGHLFNVGTGFSEDQRQLLWETRDSLPGRTATVKYQHITSGKRVPRFPVFVCVK